ncbi:MAG: hypothetical protein IT168_19845 [Bryobacterales bacterium]|nr:hypothetical protein [Bryobacterales bacterium]
MQRLICFLAFVLSASSAELVIDKPMPAPNWALLERQLLAANSAAAQVYHDKYLDERGYLLHTPRWGTLDGPDDAIETFYNWTLLYALGADQNVLDSYKKALEGHLQQYKELRTVKTKLAENGAYYKEFVTQSDWFHTGEGMRGFMFLGLADPHDQRLISRIRRFAGLYMNEDPEAPNYDPVNKVIKSIWTGSKGPMMHKATTYDWVGDPVPGSFHLLHGPKGRQQLIDLMSVYPKMLAHCAEYLDSVGDHPLNMASTGLATNAYMLTGDPKYKAWVLEYIGAWKARTAMAGGNIPTNVGLDGKPGGEYGGKWWKGTYGWNFTIYDGEIDKMASRNTVEAASWPGFGNAYLLSKGDASFVDTLRKQLDNLWANKKVVNGRTMLPQMYGDPRGYKYSDKAEWYEWTPNLHAPRQTEIYMWSMNPADLERVPVDPWLKYIAGQDADYPEKALRRDLEEIRRGVIQIENDPTSPDTRLADYVQGMNPTEHDALTKLTTGAYLPGNIWTLHARVRYFDPARNRPGLPQDVAALVQKFDANSTTLTVVNTSPVHYRTVYVQAGAYAEHDIVSATVNGKTVPVNNSAIRVKLAPGSGGQMVLNVKRYANEATLRLPWER